MFDRSLKQAGDLPPLGLRHVCTASGRTVAQRGLAPSVILISLRKPLNSYHHPLIWAARLAPVKSSAYIPITLKAADKRRNVLMEPTLILKQKLWLTNMVNVTCRNRNKASGNMR